METPLSSTRRVTRSQTSAAANNTNPPFSKKALGSENTGTKTRQRNAKTENHQDRSALIDITNDSPIVGVAMANLETPVSSAMSKKRMIMKSSRTPGSGEALLRGQVKTLLQKVEEEAELSRVMDNNNSRPFFNLKDFINSPISLLAPTPANTPQVLNLSESSTNALHPSSINPSPIIQETILISQREMVVEGSEVEEENLITRSLLLDFSDKSDSSDCSSVLTYQGAVCRDTQEKVYTDDDDASIWSIQVNASSSRDEEELDSDCDEGCLEQECRYAHEEDEDKEIELEYGTDELLDELCEGISKISVDGVPKFEGKHIRFVYNSDDELQGEEEVEVVAGECKPSSPFSACDDVLRLKGLPTPKGKHLRFPQESEEN